MLALTVATPTTAEAQAGESYFVLYGADGDYISQGNDAFFAEDADTLFVPSVNFDNGVSVRIDVYSNGLFQEQWHVNAAAPGDAPLAAGDEFEATRFPFQAPETGGLSVFGDGRGCNQSTGEFAVRELTVATDGTVEQFAMDFRQSCDGGTDMVGGIRINSLLDNPDPDFMIGNPPPPPPPADTTPPTSTADLDQTGRIKGTSSSFFVVANCTDDNPGAALVSADINGISVEPGQKVQLALSNKSSVSNRKGKLSIKAPSIELTVQCIDAAGNTSTATAAPVFN